MRTDHYSDYIPHCVSCGKEIPADRPRQAITCSDECRDTRKNYRRSRQDARECRYCRRPSTPQERLRYSRWRKFEEKNPPPVEQLAPHEIVEREYKAAHPPKKRGPKKKQPAPVEIEQPTIAEDEGASQ